MQPSTEKLIEGLRDKWEGVGSPELRWQAGIRWWRLEKVSHHRDEAPKVLHTWEAKTLRDVVVQAHDDTVRDKRDTRPPTLSILVDLENLLEKYR